MEEPSLVTRVEEFLFTTTIASTCFLHRYLPLFLLPLFTLLSTAFVNYVEITDSSTFSPPSPNYPPSVTGAGHSFTGFEGRWVPTNNEFSGFPEYRCCLFDGWKQNEGNEHSQSPSHCLSVFVNLLSTLAHLERAPSQVADLFVVFPHDPVRIRILE